MGSENFLFASFLLILFLFWFQANLGVAIVSGNPNTTITVPSCNVSADPMLVGCVFSWVGFIFSLSSLHSSFVMIDLFISALVIADFYIALKLVRGGG